jgi:hypothetical protein
LPTLGLAATLGAAGDVQRRWIYVTSFQPHGLI